MDYESKALTAPVELKADGAGQFVATFATLNVIDLHGDVTVDGAFTDGAAVLIGQYDHAQEMLGAYPVGKGLIAVDGDTVRVAGEFFLDTPHGDAAYKTIKHTAELMQWSYVYGVKAASFGQFEDAAGIPRDVRFLEGLDVKSVDPVARGAGIGTRTDAVKGAPTPYHQDLDHLIAEVGRVIARTEARHEMRAKDNRTLSADDLARVTALSKGLADLGLRLVDVLPAAIETIDLQRERMKFEQASARRFLVAGD